jgi:hypothetical protein
VPTVIEWVHGIVDDFTDLKKSKKNAEIALKEA